MKDVFYGGTFGKYSKDSIERFDKKKEQKSNYNEPEYTANNWANERFASDKELDNEEIDFINGEHLIQGWDYE